MNAIAKIAPAATLNAEIVGDDTFANVVEYEPIYKRDSKGKVRILKMQLGWNDDTDAGHRVISGLEEGKQAVTGWTHSQPKNIGKANETSSHQQAEAEVQNKYKRKLDREYFVSRDDIDSLTFVSPMLAAEWKKRKDKIKWEEGVYIQPKLDGFRNVAQAEANYKRSGMEQHNAPNVKEALAETHAEQPELAIDGELYNHEYKDKFNKLSGILRREEPTTENLTAIYDVIQLHIYDVASHPGDFSERLAFMEELKERFEGVDCIQFVETVLVYSLEEAEAKYQEWLEDGYEGMMVRINRKYKVGGRSNDLIKRKEFEDAEFRLLEVHEGNGNWYGHAKSVTFQWTETDTCDAGIRGDRDAMKALMDAVKAGNKPDWCKISYIPGPTGYKPRFAQMIDWGFGKRDD
ncbi:hypothetical protein [Sulfitobacter sp. R18_1]|uniref:ATP-dependent DNA ligase n=1 Tax=Sulfitobacter sp. R18_1 TaxID=2821104 RepID=UPI001ADA5477|nr:hypothetical protein [Sulfitobacter sp. R18_1]MBO9428299.1 hypothetical protein [Sulfitobacter sp. R18_1]